MRAKKLDLNIKQEAFCKLYSSDLEFFGNGVEAYIHSYKIERDKPNSYKTACAAASRLLSNVKVIDRINELLDQQGLNNAFVDKQLKFLITQHADFGTKLGAIREYNKLKMRITEKHDLTTKGQPLIIKRVSYTNPVPEAHE